jgi:nucleoid DNA-binding protein
MDRLDLIDLISEKAQMTYENATLAFDAILEAVSGSLKAGDPVVLANFGTFIVNERVAKQNSTLKKAKIVGFKAGKALKEAVKSKVI